MAASCTTLGQDGLTARLLVVLSEHVAVAGEKRRIHVEARV
jgi:hypothetical protein